MPNKKPRKRRMKKSKRRKVRRWNVYFEHKSPRVESRTKAVIDTGRPGVDSPREVKMIAYAQLADYADGLTVDKKTGRVKRFTGKVWAGRTKVLNELAEEVGGKRYVELVKKYKEKLDKARTMKEKKEILMEAAEKLGIPEDKAEKIIKKVAQKRI